MKKALLATAAVLAAVAFFLLATLPPPTLIVDASAVDPELARRTVSGAYHIHTTRSDGAEEKTSIAAAAARAGLDFAIFTDHGDGTRAPDRPAYISGVLCIDGVEISTNGGHYVALDMPAAPYPLGGEAAAVVEDVARLGGFGIAAHPDSAKPALAWTDWRAPVDGIEWLNVDSEWRDERPARLFRAAFDYALRPAPAMASILDRPDETLARWAALSRQRRVVALAAADAHGGVRTRLEGSARVAAGPSYEASFRTLSNRVLLDRPLSGDAAADARALLGAIRQGRVYSVVAALASPAFVDSGSAPAAWMLPPRARVVSMGADDVRWYEVHLDTAPGDPAVPWIVTNPVDAPEPRPAATIRSAGRPSDVEAQWRIEKDAASAGEALTEEGGRVSVRFQLHAGPRASQFVAVAGDLAGQTAARQIVFDARADRPMRLSVQLRFAHAEARWTKSVYVDGQQRTIVVPVEEMVPAERQAAPMPDPATARTLLFVVDLTNAAPGTSGSFTLSGIRLLSP